MPTEAGPSVKPPRTRTRFRAAKSNRADSPTSDTARPATHEIAKPEVVRRQNPKRRARPPQYDTPTERASSDTGRRIQERRQPHDTSRLKNKARAAASTSKPAPKTRRDQRVIQPNKKRRKALKKGNSGHQESVTTAITAAGVKTRAKSKQLTSVSREPETGITVPGRRKLVQETIRSEDAAFLNATPPDSLVQPWLRSVRSPTPDRTERDRARYTAPAPPKSSSLAEQVMNSSSTSRENLGDGSTVRGPARGSGKISYQKLRHRYVNQHPSNDTQLPRIKELLESIKVVEPFKNNNEVHVFVDNLGQKTTSGDDDDDDDSSDEEYSYTDHLELQIHRKRAKYNYPIILPKYFKRMLVKCLGRNEAILQRTVMMNIFHLYWLGKKFDFNCEGQWSQPKDSRLPSREEDDITQPKPDLAITFTLSSLTKDRSDSDPVPPDLERALSPDGANDDGSRCFPFLFMEVKRATADLSHAYMVNLHNASQALYNMHQWMARAGMEAEFFDKVRVFSFVLNAQDLDVRIHRVEKGDDGVLEFRFAEFTKSLRYNRNVSCNLLLSITKGYAEKELHGNLQKAFQTVTEAENQRISSKRKANEIRNANGKRSRSSLSSTPHTGQSFNMGQLQT